DDGTDHERTEHPREAGTATERMRAQLGTGGRAHHHGTRYAAASGHIHRERAPPVSSGATSAALYSNALARHASIDAASPFGYRVAVDADTRLDMPMSSAPASSIPRVVAFGCGAAVLVAIAVAVASVLGLRLFASLRGPPYGSDGPSSRWSAAWAGDIDGDGV